MEHNSQSNQFAKIKVNFPNIKQNLEKPKRFLQKNMASEESKGKLER